MTPQAINTLCRALAILMFVVGGLGSIACLPFAFSASIVWITTAGIYFVAGGTIMAGGLVSYVLLTNKK
jgi:hypothetical protein